MASLPASQAAALISRVNSADQALLISARTQARSVLYEVGESRENLPNYDTDLDERATGLAYSLLHAGCALAEDDRRAESAESLTKAAVLLQNSYAFSPEPKLADDYHLLLASMAYYAAGHYSRAFVLIRYVEVRNHAAGLVAAFLRKDFAVLVQRLNAVLLNPNFSDARIAASLDGENEERTEAQALDHALTVLTARALALALEFILSGNAEDQGRAREILLDAVALALAADEPSWWWTARLLVLMLDDLREASPWTVLPPLSPPDAQTDLDVYLRLLPFLRPRICELWTSQRACLEKVLDQTVPGAAVSLRTSGGKTRVAEIAILFSLLAAPEGKVIYLAPFRSLAFEVEENFKRSLGPLGYTVSHLYSGARSGRLDEGLAEDAHVIVATPEKLRALMRSSPMLAPSVKLIVVDEGHLLGLSERLIRNELFLDHLKLMCERSRGRLLLLSAVLPNVIEIAQWLTGSPRNVATSDWKPSAERFGLLLWDGRRVRLEWHDPQQPTNPSFVTAASRPVQPGRRATTKGFPSNKAEAIAATALRLTSIGPVLIFVGNATSIRGYTEAVLAAMPTTQPIYQWPREEWQTFEAVCIEHYETGALEWRAAKLGVLCHSARLPDQVRLSMERLMAARPPLVVLATSTLAQGVNLGISTVIFASVYVAKEAISTRDFWNISGRAGRAFVDLEGKVLYAIDETEGPGRVARERRQAARYFDQRNIQPVQSGILGLLNHLKRLAEAAGMVFADLLEIASENDLSRIPQGSEAFRDYFDLVDDEVLAIYDGILGDDEAAEETDVSVDELLRKSLAYLQAGKGEVFSLQPEQVISLLRARLRSALNRCGDRPTMKVMVSTGMPLNASFLLHGQRDAVLEATERYVSGTGGFEDLVELVRFFERLALSLPNLNIGKPPTPESLELLRVPWLSGLVFQKLLALHPKAEKITHNFHRFVLPWTIHAAAKQARSSGNTPIADVLDRVAFLVELGLPDETAGRIFLAGVRSRHSATELSKHFGTNLEDVRSAGIVRFLLHSPVVAAGYDSLTGLTRLWLKILAMDEERVRQTHPPALTFAYADQRAGSVLHVRKWEGRSFLCNPDYTFHREVIPNAELPFSEIADDLRCRFLRSAGQEEETWQIELRDPHLNPPPDHTASGWELFDF